MTMRPRALLALFLVAMLAVSAIPFAVASEHRGRGQDRGPGSDDDASTNSGPGSDDDRAELRAARLAARAELRAARVAALEGFHDARKEIISDYHDALEETRRSFQENKTAVLAACREARDDPDSPYAYGPPEWQHCVRDGLKPLIEKARGEIKDAQHDAREALHDLRATTLTSFHHGRAEIFRSHGHHGAAALAEADADDAADDDEEDDSDEEDADDSDEAEDDDSDEDESDDDEDEDEDEEE